MGQKVSPIGSRLGIVKGWDSIWWSEKNLGNWVVEDQKIRHMIMKRFRKAELERVKIERTPGFVKIIIRTGKPALLIGQKGVEIEALKKKIVEQVKDKKNTKIDIKIEEVKRTTTSGHIVAINLANQIERNFPFKRAMKKSIADAMKDGAKGIKIKVSGRLAGAEMAREEWYAEGRIPTQTLRADIDYATAEALTKYGIIGIKIWIFKGEIIGKKSLFEAAAPEGAPRDQRPFPPKKKKRPDNRDNRDNSGAPKKKDEIVMGKRRVNKAGDGTGSAS